MLCRRGLVVLGALLLVARIGAMDVKFEKVKLPVTNNYLRMQNKNLVQVQPGYFKNTIYTLEVVGEGKKLETEDLKTFADTGLYSQTREKEVTYIYVAEAAKTSSFEWRFWRWFFGGDKKKTEKTDIKNVKNLVAYTLAKVEGESKSVLDLGTKQVPVKVNYTGLQSKWNRFSKLGATAITLSIGSVLANKSGNHKLIYWSGVCAWPTVGAYLGALWTLIKPSHR